MRGDECHRKVKLVPSARNRPMHNSRKASKIRTLGKCILKVKGVKLQNQNETRLSNDKNKDEGLYNELKVWKPASGPCKCSYSLNNKTRLVNSCESN